MSSVRARRHRVVVGCAVTYPLVWAAAAVVGVIAAVTSDVETDTRGLGDGLAGFATGRW